MRVIARVLRVIDGDTFDVEVRCFNVTISARIRLYGVNAPEIKGESRPEGLRAKEFVAELIEGKDVLLDVVQDRREKYGRVLSRVILEDGRDLSELLLDEGLAVVFMPLTVLYL